MDYNLMKTRAVAFGYEALALIVTGVATLLLSPEFTSLVEEHFGGTIVASLIILVISGGAKHIRNLKVIRDHSNLGAQDGGLRKPPMLI